jgi:hypothetical protein
MGFYKAVIGSIIALAFFCPSSGFAAKFTVKVLMTDVVDLASASITLGYDPGNVSFISAEEGPFMKGGGQTFFIASDDPSQGLLSLDCAILGEGASVSGSGLYATVTFDWKSKDPIPKDPVRLVGAELIDSKGGWAKGNVSLEIVMPLQISIKSPVSGAILSTAKVELSGSITPPDLVSEARVFVNGKDMGGLKLGVDGSFSVQIELVEGKNSLKVVAKTATDLVEASTDVILDTKPPELSISISPKQVRPGGDVSITVVSNEALKADPTVVVKDAKGVAITVPAPTKVGNTYTYSIKVPETTAVGDASVSVEASDLAGNKGTASGKFTVVVAPIVSVKVTLPAGKTLLKDGDKVLIDVTSDKDLAKLPTVHVTQKGGVPSAVAMKGDVPGRSFSGEYVVVKGFDGAAVVEATGVDELGNVSEVAKATFEVDTREPKVYIVSPKSSSPIDLRWGEEVSISFGYTEDHPESYTVELLDPAGNPIASKSVSAGLLGGSEIAISDKISLPQGEGDAELGVRITLRDMAGNVGMALEPGSVRVKFVDTTPPWIVSTEPQDGSKDVAVDQGFSVLFSEPMDKDSVLTAFFRVTNITKGKVLWEGLLRELVDKGYVSVSWDQEGRKATATPLIPLDPGTTYKVELINDNVRDLAGNRLVTEKVSGTFTTRAYALKSAIVISDPDSIPADGTSTSSIQIMVLDERDMPAPDGTEVVIEVSDGELIGTGGTEGGVVKRVYKAGKKPGTVSIKVMDKSGKLLGEGFVNLFSPDTTPPTLIGISPKDGDVVKPDVAIKLKFSEPMDRGSISLCRISITENGVQKASGTMADLSRDGMVTLGWDEGDSLISISIKGIGYSKVYEIGMDLGSAKDVAGNSISGKKDISMKFSVIPGPPALAEVVLERESLPADGKSTMKVRIVVKDENGGLVADGTEVVVEASDGEVIGTGGTVGGIVERTYRAGEREGRAILLVKDKGGKVIGGAEISLLAKPSLKELRVEPGRIVGQGDIKITLIFTEDMDTSIQPDVSLGSVRPYSEIIVRGSWQPDKRSWIGVAKVDKGWGDGKKGIAVSGAKGASGIGIDSFTADGILTVDTTGPSFKPEAWLEPIVGKSSLELSIVVEDVLSGVDPKSVSLLLDGKEVGAFDAASGKLSAHLDGLEDGLHSILLQANDSVGNKGSLKAEFVVDTKPPDLKLDPLPALTNKPEISVTGIAKDPNLDKVRIDPGGVEARLEDSSFSGTTLLREGKNTISVIAKDKLGREAKAEVEVVLDTTPPDPPRDQKAKSLPGGVLELSWSLSRSEDVAGYDIYMARSGTPMDFSKPIATLPSTASSWRSGKLEDGGYVFVIRARDLAGNEEKNLMEIKGMADSTPPSLLSVSAGKRALERGQKMEVSVEFSEELDGNPLLSVPPGVDASIERKEGNKYIIVVNVLEGAKEGPVDIPMRFKDLAGNEAEAKVERAFTVIPAAWIGLPGGDDWTMLCLPRHADKLYIRRGTEDVKPDEILAYRWDPGIPDDPTLAKYRAVEVWKAGALGLGQSAWVKILSPVRIEVIGTPADDMPGSVKIGDVLHYPVQVLGGWNQVGNPFSYAIMWRDVKVRKGGGVVSVKDAGELIDDAVYFYENGEYRFGPSPDLPAPVLEPWRGFWIYASQPCEILFPGTAAAGIRMGAPTSPYVFGDLVLKISAFSASSCDRFNYISIGGKLFARKPPSISKSLRVWISDSRFGDEELAATWVPKSELPRSWKIHVVAEDGARIEISSISGIPDWALVFVKDLGSGKAERLGKAYISSFGKGERTFELTILPAQSAFPPNATLSLVFPSPIRSAGGGKVLIKAPFRPERVEFIFRNVAGQIVKRDMVDGPVSVELNGAWVCNMPIDPRLPPGIYICEVRITGGEGKEKGRVVTKLMVGR